MSKRPSLQSLTRTKPSQAAPAPIAAPAPPADPVDDVRAMTLRLPKALMRDLKLRALDEERSASEIIRTAIEQYIRNAGGSRA